MKQQRKSKSTDLPPIITPVEKDPLESKVETYYKKEIAKLGGISFKFTSPQRRSVTDQVTLLFGRVIFVEMKRKGKSMTPKQELFRDKVIDNGGEHCCIAGHDGVDKFIVKLKSEMKWYQKAIAFIFNLVIRFKGETYR